MVDVGGEAASSPGAWLAPFLDVLGRKTRRTWVTSPHEGIRSEC